MRRTLLTSKIHRATVTGSDLHDIGSDPHVTGPDLHVTGSDPHVTGPGLHDVGSDLHDIRSMSDRRESK